MKVSIHKDNSGEIILASNLPTKFTPRSTYYATGTIWFREGINKREITLFKIATTERLGYLFTKFLPRVTFEYLRNKIMGC